MSWLFEAEPVDDGFFYIINNEEAADFYIQNEPTEDFQTSDHFYILTDIYIDTEWYVQNEPTERDGDQFYIEGAPSENDFYIKDYLEVPNTAFYLAILFDPGEEVAFYFRDYDEVDNTGFITESEYDAGRHDWKDQIDYSADPLSTVEHLELAVEDLNMDVEDMQLTISEVQTDASEWTFISDE